MGWQTVPKAHRASPTLKAHRASPTLENHQRATHAKTHRVGPGLQQFYCRAQDLGSTNKDRHSQSQDPILYLFAILGLFKRTALFTSSHLRIFPLLELFAILDLFACLLVGRHPCTSPNG